MADKEGMTTCPFHNRICQIDCEALVGDDKDGVSCLRVDVLEELQELIAVAVSVITGIAEAQNIPGFGKELPEIPLKGGQPELKVEEGGKKEGEE